MSLAPAITVLLVTGGEDVMPALSSSIAGNRRDDVEWLVVDNGSAPVAHPAEIAGMPVRWLNSPAGDGHLAFSRGAAAALGSYVFPILPGDLIEADSLSLVLRDWQAIPAGRRARLCGITGLIETGAPSGVRAAMSPFPTIEAEPADLRYRHGWTGQAAFTIRVELARALTLPGPGGALPPLEAIWISASRGWKTYAVNERLISRNGPALLSLEGEWFEAREALSYDLPRLIRSPSALLEIARTYHQTGREQKKSLRAQFGELSGSHARTAWLITFPLSRNKAEKSEESPPAPVTTLPFSASAISARPARGRLVLLARSLDVPGEERELVTLAAGLHQRHIDVRVVVFYRGPLERELTDAGVPLTILEKRGRWDLFRFPFHLARTLRQLRPTVILGYAGSPSIYAQLLRPVHRARIAWRLEPARDTAPRRTFSDRITSRIEHSLAGRVSLFIAGSQTARERAIERGYSPSRIMVIPNGVNLDHFRRDDSGRNTTRNAWRIPETSRLIGQVGPLVPNQDYPTFLQAAAIVAKTRPDVHFVCIGGGAYHASNELRRLGDRLGLGERIIWTGAVTLQASTYSALDLLVNSSSSGEGVPIAIAEAMACGVPVVTTDAGDAAWAAGDDRFVVPPANPEALAEAMLRLLRDVDDRLTDQGALRARIDRDLSVERFLDRMQAALFGANMSP